MVKISNAIVAIVITMLVASFVDISGFVFRLTEYGLIGGLLGIGVLFLMKERTR